MMTKTKGLVLRSVKYGEGALIVDMLTEKVGRVSFLVRLSKSQKGKMRKQYFMPLTLVDMDFDYRVKASLQRLRDIHIWLPLSSLALHPYKLSIGLFLAEFLCHATRDEHDNEALFQFVTFSMQWLDGVERDFSNFHLVFMMRLSRFIGFFPNVEQANEGGYFDLINGCFTDRIPDHAHFLIPEEAGKISLLLRLNYKTMHLCAMSRVERNRCTEVILEYYRLHVPGFPQLKSLDVLKTLFC
jgi:DNA repair protein RecO (recombination protein O)